MIREYIENNVSPEHKAIIRFKSKFTQRVLKSLERALVFNQDSIGLVQFSKTNPAELVQLTFNLDKLNLAKTKVTKNYNSLSFNLSLLDKELVEDWRQLMKVKEYALRLDTTSYPANLTKVNGKMIDTGLVRKGFAKVAKRKFSFDTSYLEQFRRPILQNIIKGITKSIDKGMISTKYFADKASYTELANALLDHYIANPDAYYNLERNNGESRGRSNFHAQKRIGNPITYKDFRAIMQLPEEASRVIYQDDKESLNAIYYFIAELVGNKATTEEEVIEAGKQAYSEWHLPKLNLKTEEGRKDLHEYIWLERIYKKLKMLYSRAGARLGVLWDIPLEIDARMCVAQFYGALTNDKDTLESVCLLGDKINDPWEAEGIPRSTAKLLVAVLYGSSQTSRGLMKAKNLDLDPAVIKRMNQLRKSGRFAVMEAFKNALIGNYTTHEPVVRVNLWNQSFDIHVNKFTTHGTEPIATQAWDSTKQGFKVSITHEPIKLPDYKRMKLFWATCCVHGLESQVFDELAYKEEDWLITNHDAILAAPWTCKRLRTNYATKLKAVNRDRYKIIQKFRQSIGAVTPKSDADFYKVSQLVTEAPDLEFNAVSMK